MLRWLVKQEQNAWQEQEMGGKSYNNNMLYPVPQQDDKPGNDEDDGDSLLKDEMLEVKSSSISKGGETLLINNSPIDSGYDNSAYDADDAELRDSNSFMVEIEES